MGDLLKQVPRDNFYSSLCPYYGRGGVNSRTKLGDVFVSGYTKLIYALVVSLCLDQIINKAFSLTFNPVMSRIVRNIHS